MYMLHACVWLYMCTCIYMPFWCVQVQACLLWCVCCLHLDWLCMKTLSLWPQPPKGCFVSRPFIFKCQCGSQHALEIYGLIVYCWRGVSGWAHHWVCDGNSCLSLDYWLHPPASEGSPHSMPVIVWVPKPFIESRNMKECQWHQQPASIYWEWL